jgi:GNAT superfamily N-acetyltransferase
MTKRIKTYIRRLQEKDAAQCCAIINACVRHMDGLNIPASDYIIKKNSPESLYKELNQYYTLVYICDDTILGLGSLDGNEIKRMYTQPSAQRQGIGRELLKCLEKEAKCRGIQRITLQSSPSAAQFYQVCGYDQIGLDSFEIGDAEFLVINMEKYL